VNDLKNNPKLNHTNDTAAYGLMDKIPDKVSLNSFIDLHTEAVLEV